MICAGIAMASIVSSASASYAIATYTNDRFGFVIVYRSDLLLPQPEAENGDGRAFNAKSGKAQILVYGGYNALSESPSELATRAESDCTGHRAQYRVVKPKLVAISCITAGGILYQKTMIVNDTLTTLRATYPANERKTWDGVIAAMSRSLVPAPGE
jgi:hypothetical protein